jgi:hypothetical protein
MSDIVERCDHWKLGAYTDPVTGHCPYCTIEALRREREPGYWRNCHDIAEATNTALRKELAAMTAERDMANRTAEMNNIAWDQCLDQLAATTTLLESHRQQYADKCLELIALRRERDALLAEKGRWADRATHYLGTTCENVSEVAILKHQLAAMTAERDAERYKHEQSVTINERLLSDLRISQAYSQQLREALEKIERLPYDEVPDHHQTIAHEALSIPNDDTCLRQAKAELLPVV